MEQNGLYSEEYGENAYMEQEEEWEREGLLDPAWEKQQKKVSEGQTKSSLYKFDEVSDVIHTSRKWLKKTVDQHNQVKKERNWIKKKLNYKYNDVNSSVVEKRIVWWCKERGLRWGAHPSNCRFLFIYNCMSLWKFFNFFCLRANSENSNCEKISHKTQRREKVCVRDGLKIGFGLCWVKVKIKEKVFAFCNVLKLKIRNCEINWSISGANTGLLSYMLDKNVVTTGKRRWKKNEKESMSMRFSRSFVT